MTWNYRIGQRGEYLEIVEVYYTAGQPESYCRASVGGDSVKEIRAVLGMMKRACARPVIDLDEWDGRCST